MGNVSIAADRCVIWASALGLTGAVLAQGETSVLFARPIGRVSLNVTLGL